MLLFYSHTQFSRAGSYERSQLGLITIVNHIMKGCKETHHDYIEWNMEYLGQFLCMNLKDCRLQNACPFQYERRNFMAVLGLHIKYISLTKSKSIKMKLTHLLNVEQTCWEPNQHQIFLWLWCGCKTSSSIFVLHTTFPEFCIEGTKSEHRRKETTLTGTYWCKKPAAQTLLLLNKNVCR